MVYLLLAPGFEEGEAVIPCDILRRGGVEVTLVGMTGDLVPGSHGIEVKADVTFADADFSDLELLVLPGGLGGTNFLAAHPGARERILRAAAEGKWLSAICAAPTVYGGLGLLDGRRAVCYPGMESGLGGAIPCPGEPVVVDGQFITGEGPGAAYAFGFALLKALKGEQTAQRVRSEMVCR